MFSIKESLKYGWDKFKTEKAIWAISLVMLVLTYLSGGSSWHSDSSYHNSVSFGLIPFLAFVALLFVRIGYTKILLKISDGEHFEWPTALEQLFKTQGVFWKFYLTAIFYGAIVAIGFVLLIVPGLFILPTYVFATLLVVDLGLKPGAAMKESALITKGSRMKLLGFIIVLGLINIIGAIALGVGLFITIPVSVLATIQVYRKLSAAKLALVK